MKPDGGIETGDVLLGKYEIQGMLGRGGMGLVYRAQHLQLHEPVAIKVLRADVQLDDEAVTRFQREAQAAVRLKSEHVARIHDVGVFDDGSPYMVMEFLAGADLGSLVDTNGPTDVATAIDLMLQACDALAEAHAAGIVHRDVKPSNLFVTSHADGTNVLKILDFGISKSAAGTDLSLTQTASVLGTPAYMSPEQMRSARRVDARTDIWSLGTVLYELVEGRRPFKAETFSEMCVMAAVDPHDPMVLAPALEPIIERCLAKTPEARYQTIAELAAALAPLARDPSRAAHYVARAQRVLGRAASATPTPVNARTLPVTPMPKPPAAAPNLAGEPGTLSGFETGSVILQRSHAGKWIAGAAVIAAFATIIIVWQARKPATREGAKYTMEAVPGSNAAQAQDAGAATPTPDAHELATTAGSNAVATGGSNAVATGGSAAPKNRGGATASGSGTGRRPGSGKKPGGTVTRGSAATAPPIEPKGSAAPPTDAGSATVKKCNVWESRTGCQ